MFGKIRKLLTKVEVWIAIASTVFGIIASQLLDKLLDPLFDTTTKAVLFGLLFLAALVAIAVVITGVFANRYDKALSSVHSEVQNINQRLGLTVQFIRDPPQHSSGLFYRRAREIIERAEEEILVLYSAQTVYSSSRAGAERIETVEYKEERSKYWQTLVDKLEQNKEKNLFYRRVLQFPEGRDVKVTEDRIGIRQIEHYKAVLNIVKEYPEAGYVKKAPLFLDQTFLVVDRKYVIWSIDSLDPELGIRYVEGALFIEDPHKEFIHYLVSFFSRVDTHGLVLMELPEE